MSAPVIIRTLADLRAITAGWQRAGETIGVVPTMGALHDGHLSLVHVAKTHCDRIITTIFVNPKQFNSEEDLKNYPRTEEEDARKLTPLGVDVVYVPDGDQMYPDGFCTTVSLTGLTDVLCGAHRPGHFDGVATVVTKLFTQTSATHAFFGEKDFQQLQIVTRLARDLDIPVEVIGCPTIREEDGLAMSSRNLLLSDRSRIWAPKLNEVMEQIAQTVRAGGDFQAAQEAGIETLKAANFTDIDYLELRTVGELALAVDNAAPVRLFAAAWLAGVRLIDNIAV